MQRSFPSLTDNLLHKNQCKDCECSLKYENIKGKSLQFNFPDRKKNL